MWQTIEGKRVALGRIALQNELMHPVERTANFSYEMLFMRQAKRLMQIIEVSKATIEQFYNLRVACIPGAHRSQVPPDFDQIEFRNKLPSRPRTLGFRRHDILLEQLTKLPPKFTGYSTRRHTK